MTHASVEPDASRPRLAAVALASTTGAMVFVCFLLLGYLATGVEKGPIEASLRAAYDAHQFPVVTTFLEDVENPNAGLGVHVFLECNIMGMVIREPASRLAQAVTPLELGYAPGREEPEVCESLRDYVYTSERDGWPGYYRHRYLHGLRPIAVIGTSLAGVAGFREAVRRSTSLVVLVLVGLAAWRAYRAWRRAVAGEAVAAGQLAWHTALAMLSVAFAVLWGVPLHAMTISHGVPTLVLFGFLLLSAVVNFHGLGFRRLVWLSAAFGAVIVEFDYLIGALPVGLALLIGVLAIQPTDARDACRKRENVGVAALAYVVAAATVLAAKQVVAVLSFGPGAWTDTVAQVTVRTGFDQYSPSDALRRFAWAAGQLALGNRAVGRFVLVLGPLLTAAVFVAAYLTTRDREHRTTLALLALSAVVIVLWYAAFWNHAAQHSYFMVHPLGWALAAGLAATTLRLLWAWQARASAH